MTLHRSPRRRTPMTLCRPDQSTLLIVDLQARLMPAIDDGDAVVRRCIQLAAAARELRIPVIGTEENPEGLGPNVPEVRALCDATLRKFASPRFPSPASSSNS